ncbi:uncharacterized protein BDZ83DRAFT_24376 [Colletotrichum acutatum]|uniref:Uncharacterized protein n=1 Tax=Glomerella acutata TaxID=27357 RepID=A0AAD8XC74_GLOAC|nr:uncharacterized protein BDZ83DRAFT_24376 [Colletotrichum acutatum]KAK1717499.1 hypothetical protein BDZ83DRAFT_24376 [Colletotrichum acutatum]
MVMLPSPCQPRYPDEDELAILNHAETCQEHIHLRHRRLTTLQRLSHCQSQPLERCWPADKAPRKPAASANVSTQSRRDVGRGPRDVSQRGLSRRHSMPKHAALPPCRDTCSRTADRRLRQTLRILRLSADRLPFHHIRTPQSDALRSIVCPTQSTAMLLATNNSRSHGKPIDLSRRHEPLDSRCQGSTNRQPVRRFCAAKMTGG